MRLGQWTVHPYLGIDRAWRGAPGCTGPTDTKVCVAMPGMTGPELFAELKRRGSAIPVIFITAQADPALQPRLLAQGAASCLFKTVSELALFAAVQSALEH